MKSERLQAIGFSDSGIRRLFLAEGTLLAVSGVCSGLLGAIAYAALLMHGLRTWWVDAVGTTVANAAHLVVVDGDRRVWRSGRRRLFVFSLR